MPTDQLMTSPWIVADESDSAFELLLRPHGVERHYQNGASLYEQGEMVPGLFYLLDGSVKQLFISGDGAERLLMFVGPGCVVGEASTLDGGPAQVTTIALSDLHVLFVERRTVLRLVETEPKLAMHLSLSLARKLRTSVKLVIDKSIRNVPDQMACLLHQLSMQKGPDIPGGQQVTLPLSHQELADVLGVSRVAVSQAIAALKERGLVETGHRAVIITDPGRLRCCGDVPFCVTRRVAVQLGAVGV